MPMIPPPITSIRCGTAGNSNAPVESTIRGSFGRNGSCAACEPAAPIAFATRIVARSTGWRFLARRRCPRLVARFLRLGSCCTLLLAGWSVGVLAGFQHQEDRPFGDLVANLDAHLGNGAGSRGGNVDRRFVG